MYANLCSALAKPATAKAFGATGTEDSLAAWSEPAYKPVRDFAKRMMGRIVFLRFVQRKGWLGADSGEPEGVYENGDQDFIGKVVRTARRGNLYSGTLATLFFETLNSRRGGTSAR